MGKIYVAKIAVPKPNEHFIYYSTISEKFIDKIADNPHYQYTDKICIIAEIEEGTDYKDVIELLVQDMHADESDLKNNRINDEDIPLVQDRIKQFVSAINLLKAIGGGK